MKEHTWKSADVKPPVGVGLATILVRTDGSIKYSNFESGPDFYRPDKIEHPEWEDGFFRYNDYGDRESVCVDYWMLWEEFWEMLEGLRTEKPTEL